MLYKTTSEYGKRSLTVYTEEKDEFTSKPSKELQIAT